MEFAAGDMCCWLGKHGSKAKIMVELIGERNTKNYGVF